MPVNDTAPNNLLSFVEAMSALSVQAADAVNQIRGLFEAYQCLENLSMPRDSRTVDLSLSDRQLFTLLSGINEPMRQQISEAQAACDRLIGCIKERAC